MTPLLLVVADGDPAGSAQPSPVVVVAGQAAEISGLSGAMSPPHCRCMSSLQVRYPIEHISARRWFSDNFSAGRSRKKQANNFQILHHWRPWQKKESWND